ncbi:unnamed protein product [Zymoseptoria tritici ST99CH_1A5]|uniref:Granulins domain-containing protein n=1 Tax=Zymoseptoria tritici ST99CH_1A5 TaxID=1276529 RepID=A0A1Y6LGC6_ZYMTR|nr:unnamed protein product [Zymoseptoria tritici ST99CH_1A5]
MKLHTYTFLALITALIGVSGHVLVARDCVHQVGGSCAKNRCCQGDIPRSCEGGICVVKCGAGGKWCPAGMKCLPDVSRSGLGSQYWACSY